MGFGASHMWVPSPSRSVGPIAAQPSRRLPTGIRQVEDVVVTVVVLYGPKAVGKSQVAEALRVWHGVVHVDADSLVMDLLAGGVQPDRDSGWLSQVEAAVTLAVGTNDAVSVEATGAWDSDWQLADGLEARGHRVLRVWIFAPLEITLHRLADRTTRKVAVTESEARWLWRNACDRAQHRSFDLELDTSQLGEDDLPRAVTPLGALLTAANSKPDNSLRP